MGCAGDFVQLLIAGRIAMNGRIERCEGGDARIRFYGQIHPQAIAAITGEAARAA